MKSLQVLGHLFNVHVVYSSSFGHSGSGGLAGIRKDKLELYF